MTDARPVLTVGLTGGIASGKSTIASFLVELGAFVMDADAIAHELMAPGGRAFERVLAEFGDGILAKDGTVDREMLGGRVFSSAEALGALNAIVHPEVQSEVERRIDRYRAEGDGPLAILDAALLVETGRYRDFDRLVVSRCSRETQIRRLSERTGMSAALAAARIDCQAPLERKLEVAHYVIDTDASLDATQRETRRVHRSLLEDFRKRFG